MQSPRKKVWQLIRLSLSLAALSLGVGSCSAPRESADSTSSSIIGGSKVANPPGSGYVFIKAAQQEGALVISSTGSGTLLNNEWVLTAAHVVRKASSPEEVTVRRGNIDDPNAEERHGVRIAFHHGYLDTSSDTPQFSIDVALIQLDSPFSGTFSNTFSALSTTAMVNPATVPAMDCFGYGRRACDGDSGHLDVGDFGTDKSFADPNAEFLLRQDQSGTPISWKGDSGGPCVSPSTGEIYGVMRASVCDGSADASVVSAEAFRDWAGVIMQSLWSVRADFDGDGTLDTGAIRFDQPSLTYIMTFFWGSGGFTAIPLPALVPPFLDVQTTAGFFGNKTFSDMVVLAGGQLYSFSALSGGFFTPQFDFLPVASNYLSIDNSDLNGDGFGDLEAVRDDGTRDVYYGGANGLGTGLAVSGLPTADGGDGKFLALVSSDASLHTPQREYIQTVIAVAEGQPLLDVAVFDGDMGAGSFFDTGERGGAITCFNLWESPDGVGYGDLLATSNDLLLDDAKWSSIYHGAVSGPASAGGAHFYILDSYLANADCNDVAADVTGPFLNAFKVRATGQVGVLTNDLSFVAHDVVGDWVAETEPPDTALLDTSFDGTFNFYVFVGDAGTEIVFQDSDADVKTDDDPGNAPRGNLDVKSDGVAVGASDTIGYRVFDPSGALLFTNTNPSGNNDDTTVTDLEQITIPTNGATGAFTWAWSGVLTHNDIRVFAPLASPTTYEMYGQPTVRISPSSAQARDFWSTHLGQGAALLPIRLGFGDDAIWVRRRDQLSAILDQTVTAFGGAKAGKTSVCRELGHHHGDPVLLTLPDRQVSAQDDAKRPAAVASLVSELLGAKLNVRRAAHKGEALLDSLVYGRTMTVRQTLTDADVLLSKIDLDGHSSDWFERGHCRLGRCVDDDSDHDDGHFGYRPNGGHERHDFDPDRCDAHDDAHEAPICELSEQKLSAINDLIARLRAINAGQVRTAQPQTDSPTPHPPTLAASRPLARTLRPASSTILASKLARPGAL